MKVVRVFLNILSSHNQNVRSGLNISDSHFIKLYMNHLMLNKNKKTVAKFALLIRYKKICDSILKNN